MSMKSLAIAAMIGFAGLSLSGCVSEGGSYYGGYDGPGRYYGRDYDRSYYGGGGIVYDRDYYRGRRHYRRDHRPDRPDYNRPDRPDRPDYRRDRPGRQITRHTDRPIRFEVPTKGGGRRVIVPGANN